MGSGGRLVDVGGRHRPGGAALRDDPGPAAGRQAGPVGVVGLERGGGEEETRGGKIRKVGDRAKKAIVRMTGGSETRRNEKPRENVERGRGNMTASEKDRERNELPF